MTDHVFPTEAHHHGYQYGTDSIGTPAGPGLTLRDYVATQVLAALAANDNGTLKGDVAYAFDAADEFLRQRQECYAKGGC